VSSALVLLALAQLQLPDVLRRLGDEAEKREAAGVCAYREVTLVEELGEDGTVTGSEERTYDAELTGITVTKRDKKSVTAKGKPLADLLVEPKNAKGRKPARSPFVAELRPKFRFALEDGPTPELKRVTLEPLKEDVERPRGEAWVRASDGRIEELRVSPSKAPFLLKSVSLRFVFGDTACGHLATLIETEGEGDGVIVDTKFRTRTVLSGHEPQRKK